MLRPKKKIGANFRGQSWNKLTLSGHCIQCPIRFGHFRLNIQYYIKNKIKYFNE